MSRIDSIFAELRRQGRKGLMPFVCGGHPSLTATEEVIPALERGGACIAEIGIPFSDPIADGPVIASAMHEALSTGVTPADVFAAVARARRAGASLGLVAMVSVSIVHRAGPERFIRDAADAGFDGFIFPDLPVEESGDFAAIVRDAGLSMSLLVAPTTPTERMEGIARACTGFVYLLARVGITGDHPEAERRVDARAIGERVALLRARTPLPIACGFGVSDANDVRLIVRDAGADAAVVGSALVRRMDRAVSQGTNPVEEAEVCVRALATGLTD